MSDYPNDVWEDGFAAGRHDVLRVLPDRDEVARTIWESSSSYANDHYPWELLKGPNNSRVEVEVLQRVYVQADAVLALLPEYE